MNRKIVGIFVCMLVITATSITVVGTMEKKNEFQGNENNSQDIIDKWNQEPNDNERGVNICCDQGNETKRVLANDFECTALGYIVEIHLFGSWKNDEYEFEGIEKFNLTIYSDKPASGTSYSMPNKKLWNYEASSSDYTEAYLWSSPSPDMWWDPYTNEKGIDNDIYEYIITIPIEEAFLQQGTEENPIIYWLAVQAVRNSGESESLFGLRSAYPCEIDDTVMWNDSNPPDYWDDLYYPAGSVYPPSESIDFAFIIRCKEFDPNALVWDPPGPFDILLVDFDLINEGNDTIPHFPYEIIAVGTDGLIPTGNSSSNGTIENLQPGEAITLKTPRIIGIGPFDVTVKVMGYELGSFKSFVFLIFIFNNYG